MWSWSEGGKSLYFFNQVATGSFPMLQWMGHILTSIAFSRLFLKNEHEFKEEYIERYIEGTGKYDHILCICV